VSWQDDYLRRFYYRRPGFRGGTSEYWQFLLQHAADAREVLELGCGPANDTSAFLASHFDAVDGLDIGEGALDNHHLRQVKLYDGGAFPFDDVGYDAVVCNYVLEHVADPVGLACELQRVLRPGGVFLFRTPSKWNYVSIISRLTPHSFHERVANRVRALDDEADDPYPTFYRMNAARDLRRTLGRAGFTPIELRSIEKEPSYGMAHPALFLLFMLYERVVNSDDLFSPLRSNWLGAFRRGL
jgi:SAM-dependent methyltransferase